MPTTTPIPWQQHPDPAIGKSQAIRLIDIFLLAPAMIYVGASGEMPKWLRKWAVIGGVLTIVYNAQNYLRLTKELKRED